MPGTDVLLSFFMATALFAYMPGPAVLYAAARTIAGGRRAGWLASLGIHLGGYVHVLAAAFGLALLFDLVPSLYLTFKILGAGYLILLGGKMILSQSNAGLEVRQIKPKSSRASFWESVTVEVLNPKTALFYVAFLPQFTDQSAAFPIWLQLLVLGIVVNAMFSSADVVSVLLADRVTGFFRSATGAGRIASKIGGSILVGLGLNIALSRQ